MSDNGIEHPYKTFEKKSTYASLEQEEDPLVRAKETTSDKTIGNEKEMLAGKRRASIEQSHRMISEFENIEGTLTSSSWTQLGPTSIPNGPTYSDARVTATGRITNIVVHPKDSRIIYVGAAQGGVWKSNDGGEKWTPKSDYEVSLAIGSLVIDPKEHNILYAGTGEANFSGDSQYGLGIIKSTDGGETWKLKGEDTTSIIDAPSGQNGFRNSRFSRLVINPKKTTTIFAATISSRNPNVASGIYRSVDAGEKWIRMENGLPPITTVGATDIVLNPDNPDIAYAAFYGEGIYKTTNANDNEPLWTKLYLRGLTPGSFARIALGIALSAPQIVYALVADTRSIINKFYQTTDGGVNWNRIPINVLPTDHNGINDLGGQGNYNMYAAVHPSKSDIVYLGAISIWKAFYDANNDMWKFANIGETIHPDNHAFAFNTDNPEVIYAGNDGGIYQSNDGGKNWIDSINQGLCITQFEFMDHDPNSASTIVAGTQDNGTVRYEGTSIFTFVDGGDGGYVCIDPVRPENVLHTRQRLAPLFSQQGGNEGTWKVLPIDAWAWPFPRFANTSLFYPPIALDKTNSKNIALGGSVLYLHDLSEIKGWETIVALPNRTDLPDGATELISAINYVDSNLIYIGTNYGGVYRLTKSSGVWIPQSIHEFPLPQRHIWDIVSLPNDSTKVIVAVSGFGSGHVFYGNITSDNNILWSDISGWTDAITRLPDNPANALVLDENNPNTMYVGMDVGVFYTIDGGKNWKPLGKNLPNCQVYDMRLHSSTGFLRVATHGRGIWQIKVR